AFDVKAMSLPVASIVAFWFWPLDVTVTCFGDGVTTAFDVPASPTVARTSTNVMNTNRDFAISSPALGRSGRPDAREIVARRPDAVTRKYLPDGCAGTR